MIIRRNWLIYCSYLVAGLFALSIGLWLSTSFIRKSVSAPQKAAYVNEIKLKNIKKVVRARAIAQNSVPDVPVEPMTETDTNANTNAEEVVPLPPSDPAPQTTTSPNNIPPVPATDSAAAAMPDSVTPTAETPPVDTANSSANSLPTPSAPPPGFSPQIENKNTTALPESLSLLEPYVFDTREGRRNPFKAPSTAISADPGTGGAVGPLSSPLERYELSEITLVAILWDITNPKAMFMDPTNEVHILSKDDRIGRRRGYIAAIRESEVVIFEITTFNGEQQYATRVVRIDQQ